MSGVPIHTASPISATKPSGVTPQTAVSGGQTALTAPASNLATPTASASQSTYPVAAAGAASVPAPTPSVSRPPQQSTSTPTRTSAQAWNEEPPPPQPGATPIPFTRTHNANASLPPPPKVGETPKPPEYYTPVRTSAPMNVVPPQQFSSQMSFPMPPSQGFAQSPGSITATTNTTSSSYPTSNPLYSTQSQTQPPPTRTTPSGTQGVGYVQNPHAADLAYGQRSGTNQFNRYNNSPSLGYNGGSGSTNGGVQDGEGVSFWDTAKKWASTAQEKAIQAESDIWKRINKG
ncbi:hypothetical protein MMC16_004273 [Acarospora aff. strigata]|nr:hypothetical protein [Acarospora aff. strigata]